MVLACGDKGAEELLLEPEKAEGIRKYRFVRSTVLCSLARVISCLENQGGSPLGWRIDPKGLRRKWVGPLGIANGITTCILGVYGLFPIMSCFPNSARKSTLEVPLSRRQV